MSEFQRVKVFFLKANPNDLAAVEIYLTKRDYEVKSESNLKKAVHQILQFEPDFIFIAFDHPDERAIQIPKFISQIHGTFIPYVESLKKEFRRVLDTSGFFHRVYPPLSGPGLIRVILKIEKEQSQVQNSSNLIETASKPTKPSNMVIIGNEKAALSENFQSFMDDIEKKPGSYETDESIEAKLLQSKLIIQKGVRGELLKSNQSKLQNLDIKKIEENLKKTLKAEFQDTIKNKIIDSSQAYQENELAQAGVAKESYERLLCLVVQSETWCGYLVVASQIKMEDKDYFAILQSWLQNQFVNLSDSSENDYFELNLDNKESFALREWAKEKADYLEMIEINSNEVLIGFFSIDPKYLMIEANETFEMLEVPLALINTDKKVSLSLFLHLPDNKKYILYTPANQVLSAQQKNKLTEKFIEKLYTPVDFEKELNKLKAESYLNNSVRNLKKSAES